ncbi:MAG: hypothetical protein Q9197_003098 [Variospora fuerteventurae]
MKASSSSLPGQRYASVQGNIGNPRKPLQILSRPISASNVLYKRSSFLDGRPDNLHPIQTSHITIMVAISLVRSSNESLRNLPRHLSSPTAVFVGATQGIGLATLRQLAIHTVTPTCYIVGRSEARVQEIIGELKQLNARGTYVFVKGEVALLESVDECCGNIKAMLGEGKGLDLLYMS